MSPEPMRETLVFRVAMAHPGDVSGIAALIAGGTVDAAEIVAIFGKTEGNGCVNDFTRGYAVLAVETLLAERLGCAREAVGQTVAIVVSGGTEGGLSPHFLVFARRLAVAPRPGPGLAIGVAFTRPFLPEEIGRTAQVDETARAIAAAMADAGLTERGDVHFVQMKCPLLTSGRVADAAARGVTTATEDTYASMGLSRAASALGAAVALGEVARPAVTDASIGRDGALWSARASASAGVELTRTEVIVLGNGLGWSGSRTIHHAVMRDGIDLPAVAEVLAAAGFRSSGQLSAEEAARVEAVLVKADPSGSIRGRRTVMWDDSDVHATRHARALVGGVVAAAVGRTDLFVSGGAEHQGPAGGGPIAIVARHP